MSLQDDSSALRKNLEAEIGDKIKHLDRETEALLQSGTRSRRSQFYDRTCKPGSCARYIGKTFSAQRREMN